MATTRSHFRAVLPGNGFEYWMDVSGTTALYPVNGKSSASVTESAALWDAVLGLTDGDFIARITKIIWSSGTGTIDTLTITPRTGASSAFTTGQGGYIAPGPAMQTVPLNIPMEDGFSAVLSGGTATVRVFFEIWWASSAANIKT